MPFDPVNPFAVPGLPRAHDGIFAPRHRIGGAAPRPRKAEAPPPEAAEPYEPAPAAAEEQEKREEAVITSVVFAQETAGFGDTVAAIAEVSLPEKLAHLTRVEFTLLAAGGDGKPEPVAKAEGHVKDGKARAEFTLPKRDPKAGKPEMDFTCRAKHKHSKETEGGKLKAKADAPADLEMEIEDGASAKKDGHAFRMTGEPGKVQATVQAKDGKEKDGRLLLKFAGLDPTLKYTLECLDSQGKVLGAIFSGRKFGEWST